MGLFNLSLDCDCCHIIVPAHITPQVYYHRWAAVVNKLPQKDGVYFHYGTLKEQINSLISQIGDAWAYVKDQAWINGHTPTASPSIPSGWAFGIGGLSISAWRDFVSDIGIVYFSSPDYYKIEHINLIGSAGRHGHAAMTCQFVTPDYGIGISTHLLSQAWGLVISCPAGKSLLEATGIARVVIEYQTDVYPFTVPPPWNQYVNEIILTVAEPDAPSPLNALNLFKSGRTTSLPMEPISVGYGSCSVIQLPGFNVVGVDNSMIDRLIDGNVTEETVLTPDINNTSKVLELDSTSGFFNFSSSNGDPYIFLAFYSTPLYWPTNPLPGSPTIDFAWWQWLHGCNFVCIKRVTFYDADGNVFLTDDLNFAIFIPPGNSVFPNE